jgi:hypothetical protein
MRAIWILAFWLVACGGAPFEYASPEQAADDVTPPASATTDDAGAPPAAEGTPDSGSSPSSTADAAPEASPPSAPPTAPEAGPVGPPACTATSCPTGDLCQGGVCVGGMGAACGATPCGQGLQCCSNPGSAFQCWPPAMRGDYPYASCL